jgi:hypothetical protein
MPPYTHFQYIAYQVPTVVRDRRNGIKYVSGLDPGSECAPIQRAALPRFNIPDDARKRLKRLAAVMDMAATQVQALGTNGSTLKVFVAPEFYFRPVQPNSHNTYPPDEARGIFNALDAMFVHADFADWLIVGGTVLWNTGTNSPIYMNTAVHVQGGKENGLMFVEKRVASRMDGVPVAMTPAMTNDLSIRQIHDEWEVRKHHLFRVHKVGIGLEVCLDHYNRTLVNIRDMHNMNSLLLFNIDLQVLTAGGMYLEPGAVATKVGGYLLRNDGLPDERLLLDGQIELMKVTGYTHSPIKLERIAQLQRVDRQDILPILESNMRVPTTGIDPQEFDQMLMFYPTQPLG